MPEYSRKQTIAVLLVIGMLITGTANTILNKWQDKACLSDCDTKDRVDYAQPLWQTLQMFIGEFLCMIIYLLFESQKSEIAEVDEEAKALLPADAESDDKVPVSDDVKARAPLTGWKNGLLFFPTLCDMVATTLMNIGLFVVAPSVYQMLRGAVVVFTGILSVIFLKTRLERVRVYALFMVMVGVAIVGSTSVLFPEPEKAGDTGSKPSTTAAIVGVGLILLAQCISATQFVIEEKVMSSYTASPLKLVGLEGFFGVVSVSTIMVITHFAFGRSSSWEYAKYFDIVRGWNEFVSMPQIWATSIACALSISVFNWFGLSVTKFISATSRTTIDTCRTLFIWIFGLIFKWESFNWLQVLGFVVLIYGTFVFNRVIPAFPPVPNFCKSRLRNSSRR